MILNEVRMRNRLIAFSLALLTWTGFAKDGVSCTEIDDIADPGTYNDASYLFIAPNPLVSSQRWTLPAIPSLDELAAALQNRSFVEQYVNPGYYLVSARPSDRIRALNVKGRTLYAPPPPEPNWATVPEPTTVSLLLLGLGAFALARKTPRRDAK